MSLYINHYGSRALVFSSVPEPFEGTWIMVEYSSNGWYDLCLSTSSSRKSVRRIEMEKRVEEYVDEEIIGTPER